MCENAKAVFATIWARAGSEGARGGDARRAIGWVVLRIATEDPDAGLLMLAAMDERGARVR